MMLRKTWVLALLLSLLFGCSHSPSKDALRLNESSLADRQMQSRKFGAKDDAIILTAAADVLQDMGYILQDTDRETGLINAYKQADAAEKGEKIASYILTLLLLTPVSHDETQRIWVNFVVTPSASQADQYVARVTFQRQIFDDYGGLSRTEIMRHPQLYQKFFEALSKSVFLEAQAT